MRLSHMENLPLTVAKKSKLRGLGQKLDAILKVGKDGLTPTFITELSRTLRAHDLIKLRFVGESDRTARAALTTEIEAAGHCTCVGSVGATALFYKPASDPSKSSLPVA
jgi:RNA-binding protein